MQEHRPRCESGVKPQPPSPPPSHPGRVLLPSRVLPQPRFNVGAPPTVRKRSQTPTTEPAPFVPGAGTVRGPAPALVYVGAPPSVRKRSQTTTPEPAPFAPGAGAPTLRSPASAGVSCRSTSPVRSGIKPQPPSPPPSHPGRVLLPSRVLRQPRFHVGAPPSVRKRSQTTTPEPAPFAPGAGAPTVRPPAPAPVSCRSTAHGAIAEPNPTHRAYTLRPRGGCSYRPASCASPGCEGCRLGGWGLAPLSHRGRCESGAKPQPPSLHPSHPGRVLLPSGLLRQPRFHVGAPPTVRKRSQTTTPEPAPFPPGAGAPTLPTPAPAPVSVGATPPARSGIK